MINLTQHEPTSEQEFRGVENPPENLRKEIISLLSFSTCPKHVEVVVRARKIARLIAEYVTAQDCKPGREVMIGGAPYLMGPLETALKAEGLFPHYAFSERVSTEETLPDGSVKKVQVFRHAGFIPA